MAQKYRIYINEKVILVTETKPKKKNGYELLDGEAFDLKIIYTWISARKNNLFCVVCKDAKAFLKQVKKSVMLIEAAGGLVKNEAGEYLFIYRNGKWDLPKGKIEKDEKVKEAAVREVEEECGIKVSELGKKICKTYHVYLNRGVLVLKKTHWFDMHCAGKFLLKPQIEEGITDVRWFKKEHVEPIIANTFPSIMDVLVEDGIVKEDSGVRSREPV
ncbi:NUDIX domain-containing protein [uncultured Mucilaginibacter sp.]|uniref:NUDIX hydrolase n=1 Tax=uncultured Mucilaginibacter sp. TaxID=797541 RepID=UPI0025FB1C86|nr:NUDIX domain-containing protein [uncultured Mucilaginibacter sp.]